MSNINKLKINNLPFDLFNSNNFLAGTNIGIAEFDNGDIEISTLTLGVEYIVGTQQSSTNVWTGVSLDMQCLNSTLYVGKVIIYHLPYNGNTSPATLNLTLADNSTTGDVNVKYLSGTNVTNEFSAGYDIFMIYDGTQWKTSASGTAKRSLSIPFAKVDSTSTATAYTATVPGITELVDGTCVMLENGVVTSAAGFTLNINGLGAKPSFNNLTAATRDTTIFNVNYTMLFVYDSNRVVDGVTGAWCCYRGYDANSNTIGYQLRSNSYSKAMTDVTYRYRLLFSSADNSKWVPANTSTSTNATSSRAVCQTPINPFGEIVYYSTTASVAAGSRPSATNLWQQYTLSLGYSFNRTGAALTLTSWKPVYVKCTPQADGSAIMDSTTPYVQDLPSTDDGKIYIFLGVAYNATSIELLMNHPVFYYKDGAIRQWSNAYIPAAVQSNWNETDTSSAAYIQNKPNVTVDSLSSNGVAVAGNNFFRSGSVFISDTKNSISLDHAGDAGIDIVANDGSDGTITLTASSDIELNTSGTNKAYYNDKEIATKDDIPTVGTLNTTNTTAQATSSSESLSGTINLHKVSKTGSYSDLLNKPTIPDDNTLVHKTGDETIADDKTFTGSIVVDSDTGAVLEGTTNDFDWISNGTDTLQDALDAKQATLVSGTNIKTVDSNSLLGSGDLTVFPKITNEVSLNNTTTVGVYRYELSNPLTSEEHRSIIIVSSTYDSRVGTTVTQTEISKNSYRKRTKVGSGSWSAWSDIIDLSTYAPLASPALTGTPTAPTAASGTNTTQVATTAFVQAAVSDKADKCLVVTITRSGTSPNYTYTANKTYTEIGNALTAGTTVVLSYNSVYYWFTAKGNGNTPDLIFSNTSVDLGNTIEVAGKFFTITTSSVTYWENILTDTQQTLIYMEIETGTKSAGDIHFYTDKNYQNEITHAQVAALLDDTTKEVVINAYPSDEGMQTLFRQVNRYNDGKGGTKAVSSNDVFSFIGFETSEQKFYGLSLRWTGSAFTGGFGAISGGSGSGNITIGFDPYNTPWLFYDANGNIISESDVVDILRNNQHHNIVFDNEGWPYYCVDWNDWRTPLFVTNNDLIINVDDNDSLVYSLQSSGPITSTVSASITGTIDSPAFANNPFIIINSSVYTGHDVILNVNITPLSMTNVQIPIYPYTYQVSGTDYTGYRGLIQKSNYEIAVDIKSSGSTVTITSVGSSITVDTALSESSTNPVQNRVITAQILENEEIVATALNNLNDRVELKQDQLVSGTTIKTINNQSILGSGNITISGGGGGGGEENVIEVVKVNGTALTPDANKAVNITSVPGSIVTQDTTHRFVSDTEKTTWNGKQNALQYYSESSPDARINVSTDNTGEGSGSHGMITLACRDEMTDQAIAMSEISMDNVSLHHEEYDSSTGTTTLSQDVYIGNNGIKLNYDTSDNQGHEVVLSTNGFTYDNKQIATTDQIPSAVTESIVSGWGFTKNAGTITGITMNGSSKGTSGVVNLGTVVTSETDPVFTASAAHGITSANISTWNGKYTKPAAGIPDTDLTTAVNVRLLAQLSSSSDDGKIMKYSYSAGSWQAVKPVTIYSGSSAPSSSTGSNGDIYIQTS